MIVNNVPRLIWKHEIEIRAIHAGAKPEWIRERFGHRWDIWYNAGETIEGALDMILFTLKQEPKEVRGESELAHLKAFVRKARQG